MRDELVKLYKEYCDYIENNEKIGFTNQDFYKGSLEYFMEYLEKGIIIIY